VIDYDFLNFLNHSLHSIIKIIVQTVTRRDAAGWLVLPFQGERITVFYQDVVPTRQKNEHSPLSTNMLSPMGQKKTNIL
jgi:hypothetical protein